MSSFSEHLNQIIVTNGLTLPYLEKESGFSTALISKIKTGKRLPDSEEKMIALIKALRCSIEQEKELLSEYRIEKMGRENYLCLLETSKTLEAISRNPSIVSIKHTEYEIEHKTAIYGEYNINQIVQFIIDAEMAKNEGYLKMVVQPDYQFLMDYLLNSYSQISEIKLEHIIAFHTAGESMSDCTNMQIAGVCLKLASLFNYHYEASYYYKSEWTTSLYPYCILSSQYAILINSDRKNALFFKDKEVLELLAKQHDTLKQNCRPLFSLASNVVEFMQGYEKFNLGIDPKTLVSSDISYVPCIMTSIPRDVAFNRMNPELKKISCIVDFLEKYFVFSQHAQVTSIFALDGLKLFMEEGICYEMPKGSHSPFSIDERKIILKNFYNHITHGRLAPILIKEGTLNISPELMVSIYGSNDAVFMWNLQNTSFASCILQENRINKSFSNFLEYVQSSEEYTYSKEESYHIVTEYIKNLLRK